jgi:hypothetical protein
MAEAGMQRLVRRVVGRTLRAALVTWAIVFLWAVIGDPGLDTALASDRFWIWPAVVLLGALAALAFVAWLVAPTDQSPDQPLYRL